MPLAGQLWTCIDLIRNESWLIQMQLRYPWKRSLPRLPCDVSHKVKHQTKIYLKVFVDERLPIRFDLPELWPQSFDLALHSHDILKVPLRPQVQHLDWLWHVLHLLKRMKQRCIDFSVHHKIKMSPMFSLSVGCHALTSQRTNQHFDLQSDCLLTIQLSRASYDFFFSETWYYHIAVFPQFLNLGSILTDLIQVFFKCHRQTTESDGF